MLCSSNFLSKNISDNGNRSVKRNKTIKNLNSILKWKDIIGINEYLNSI